MELASDMDSGLIYMYKMFFTRLRIWLPFIDFQNLLLAMLNVTPTQLHPNNWAFEVLSRFLGQEVNTGMFFYFFQSKGVEKNSWVSLNDLLRRQLLKSKLAFFLGIDGLQKYPLY